MKKILIVTFVLLLSASFSCIRNIRAINLPGNEWEDMTKKDKDCGKGKECQIMYQVKELKGLVNVILSRRAYNPITDTDDKIVQDTQIVMKGDERYRNATFTDMGYKALGPTIWRLLKVKTDHKGVDIFQDIYITKKGNLVYSIIYTALSKSNYLRYYPDLNRMLTDVRLPN